MTWCTIGTVQKMLKGFTLLSCPLCLSSTLILPSLNDQQHSDISSPSLHSLQIHHFPSTICPLIFIRWTFLACENCITALHVYPDFQFLCSSLMTMKREIIMTTYYTTDIFLLTYRRWLTFTESACNTCTGAIHNQFLFSGPALYVPIVIFKNLSVIYTYQWESRQILHCKIEGLSLHTHVNIWKLFLVS